MHVEAAQSHHRHDVSTAAATGLAAVAIFLLATVLMHVLQPELDPATEAVSYYMNGRLGWVLGLGLVSLGAGSIAIARGLAGMLSPGRGRAGAILLGIWGTGALVGGLFPPDPPGNWARPPSLSGMMHNGAALVAFCAFPVAALLLSYAMRGVATFRAAAYLSVLAWASAASVVAFFACLAPVFANRPPILLGLVERVLLACFLAWLAVAAGALTVAPASGLRSAPPAGGGPTGGRRP